MLKLSIMTPVYGVEKYIEQCVHSLFGQSYTDIEYIFVNDCTPDHSIDILKKVMEQYPDRARQVRIIDHPQNKGVGAARQTALMAATGDYVMFADSDDFMPADAVEKLMDKAQEETDGTQRADIVDGAYAEWNKGKVSPTQEPSPWDGERYLKLLICQNIINNRLWGRIYKRSLIMEHKIFFQEGVNYAEDLLWNAQFHFYARKTFIRDVVYYYRTDNINSYNHNISAKNLTSYFQSIQSLATFLQSKDAIRTYRNALDIGIVNAYRWARNAKVDLRKVDQAISYRPHNLIIRGVISLIKMGMPVRWTNFIYLSYRRIYASTICR